VNPATWVEQQHLGIGAVGVVDVIMDAQEAKVPDHLRAGERVGVWTLRAMRIAVEEFAAAGSDANGYCQPDRSGPSRGSSSSICDS
jgi:hypothetical protein